MQKETAVAEEGFDPSSPGYHMEVPMSPAVELVSIVSESKRSDVTYCASAAPFS